MKTFGSNLKFLRKRKNLTQEEVARVLEMKRSTLSGYENGIAQPSVNALIRFSTFYNTSLDTLIKSDLSALSDAQISEIEKGLDVFVDGSKLRILTATIDQDNEENIELVSEKAKAGYKSGFADPDYIKVLPTFQLPFLSRQKKYRTFQISGDSMLPVVDGSYVTGEFVLDWNTIRDGQAYIILTKDDGIVFKLAENKIKADKKIILHSLNTFYEPYEINIVDVKEVWKFVNFISNEMPEANQEKEDLVQTVKQLRKEVKAIQTRLNI